MMVDKEDTGSSLWRTVFLAGRDLMLSKMLGRMRAKFIKPRLFISMQIDHVSCVL